MIALGLVAFWLVAGMEIPPAMASEVSGPAWPMHEIIKQPVFLTALMGSVAGYALMIMIMTATPLAMQICGHPTGAAATVIQWHVLGMFVPSLFTGHLIKRFGVLTIMGAGALLIAGQVVAALSGIDVFHFVAGLILLGVGWNFLFIGGTTLLTEAYRPSERAKTQAAHDFLMFGAITAASFSSGSMRNAFGWQFINLTAIPFLIVAILMILGYRTLRRHIVLTNA